MPTPPYFLFVRPNETVNAYRDNAPSVSGAVTEGYNPDWLVDGQGGRPVRSDDGSISLSVDYTGETIDFIGLANHNVDRDIEIAIGGDVSGTITSTGPGKHPYLLLPTPVSTAQVTISVTGNSVPVILGELVIGLTSQPERPMEPGGRRTFPQRNLDREGVYNSIPVYDYGVRPKALTLSTSATQAGIADLEDWFDTTKDRSLYTAIIPTPSINDFHYACLKTFEYSKRGPQWFTVNFVFEEDRLIW